MAVKASISWQGNMKFEAASGSGHRLVMDAGTHAGGHNEGPRPTELVLMGLGGCSGIDVVWILQRMRVAVDRFELELEAERAPTEPRVFTRVTMVYKFWGDHLPAERIARAIKLSEHRYCSVAHMINKTAVIETYMELNGVRTRVPEISLEPTGDES